MRKKLLAALTIVGLGTISTHAAADSIWFSMSCTSGNFKGVAQGQAWPNDVPGQKLWKAYVHTYQIVKYNGQQGGNKANLKIIIDEIGKPRASSKSGDNLKQDSIPRSINVITNTSPGYMRQRDINVSVEFTFDKSGTDPKCTATKVISS